MEQVAGTEEPVAGDGPQQLPRVMAMQGLGRQSKAEPRPQGPKEMTRVTATRLSGTTSWWEPRGCHGGGCHAPQSTENVRRCRSWERTAGWVRVGTQPRQEVTEAEGEGKTAAGGSRSSGGIWRRGIQAGGPGMCEPLRRVGGAGRGGVGPSGTFRLTYTGTPIILRALGGSPGTWINGRNKCFWFSPGGGGVNGPRRRFQ